VKRHSLAAWGVQCRSWSRRWPGHHSVVPGIEKKERESDYLVVVKGPAARRGALNRLPRSHLHPLVAVGEKEEEEKEGGAGAWAAPSLCVIRRQEPRSLADRRAFH